MMFDPGIVVGGLGCLGAGASMFLVRRQSVRCLENSARTDAEATNRAKGVAEELATVREQIASLEVSLRDTDEILREGRLSRSTRAQALQVLRSGVSPDTAASTLGIARREVRLLAKVSHLLSAYR